MAVLRTLPFSWCAVLLIAVQICGCSPKAPLTSGSTPTMRLLTEEQYRNTVRDIFGNGITVAGRFDPLVRQDGLFEVGASNASVTASGFERYHGLARSIAQQVVSTDHRQTLIPCKSVTTGAFDRSCAADFLGRVGRLLYRRPLTPAEVSAEVEIAADSTTQLHDFYLGLGAALAGMLESPQFLFLLDRTEADPHRAGAIRLDAYSRASRLSFFLWNTSPSDELLTAAGSGELDSTKGIVRQVDKMLGSSHLEDGVRAFFSDMLSLDSRETLEKDPLIYPAFSQRVAADAREQILRTIITLLVDDDADYRDIFTTRKTYLTGALGLIYHIPITVPGGAWVPYEFADHDPRFGLQTQAGFLALFSHPGRSSPTLRGKAIREILLCQDIPAPPADVNFAAFNDPAIAKKSARQRLKIHATSAACAGCHKIMDPVGLTMEEFDGAGQFRTTENGNAIDLESEIDGARVVGPAALGQLLHDSPAATSCLVTRLYSYALGRNPVKGERDWLTYIDRRFVSDGYRFRKLLRDVATSDAFYAVDTSAPSEPFHSGSRTQSSLAAEEMP